MIASTLKVGVTKEARMRLDYNHSFIPGLVGTILSIRHVARGLTPWGQTKDDILDLMRAWTQDPI